MELSDRISLSLGSANSYAVYTDKVDPSLLNPLPRKELRLENKIDPSSFFGFDVWHCHEATFLLDSGMPIAGTLKIAFYSSSPYLPESKSLKVYLNTFDMVKMGKDVNSAMKNYQEKVARDLSESLRTEVVTCFFSFHNYRDPSLPSLSTVHYTSPYSSYVDLQKEVLTLMPDLQIKNYNGGNHLVTLELDDKEKEGEFYYKTNILRSRCRHTKQKDTGTAYIYFSTRPGLSLSSFSLLEHIISFREVNEFHELCCEKLFTDLINTGAVDRCCVQLLYSRRGSLDINPIRTNVSKAFDDLTDVGNLTFKQMSQ